MFVLITGGSGSGKSEIAEERTVSLGGDRVYIATMQPFDEESKKRIARHRKMRLGKGFHTVERFMDIRNLDIHGTALLECMSNLVANEMFSFSGAGDDTVYAVIKGIEHLLEKCDNLVVVTNEVFSDGIDYDGDTKRYLQNLGRINCLAAKMADEVYEVNCALSERLK